MYLDRGAGRLQRRRWLYGDGLSVTLTDTFSTNVFYRVGPSGRMKNAGYTESYHGLYFEKAKELNEQYQLFRFKCSFGTGTCLTNNFQKKSSGYVEQSKVLNIVKRAMWYNLRWYRP
ncbi:hypothetical protein BDR04DRAFT_1141939 [Suillus decipiens]|nr:hypothetical protein BDR04DRAFT_1141939 [Suillus decipiens]